MKRENINFAESASIIIFHTPNAFWHWKVGNGFWKRSPSLKRVASWTCIHYIESNYTFRHYLNVHFYNCGISFYAFKYLER